MKNLKPPKSLDEFESRRKALLEKADQGEDVELEAARLVANLLLETARENPGQISPEDLEAFEEELINEMT